MIDDPVPCTPNVSVVEFGVPNVGATVVITFELVVSNADAVVVVACVPNIGDTTFGMLPNVGVIVPKAGGDLV